MKIAIHMDQVPEEDGIAWRDYPKCTAFILDDSRPKRDPVTFQLIQKPRRTLIYPQDIAKVLKGEMVPSDKFLSLLRNGNKLPCPLCRKGRINPISDCRITAHFFCNNCGADLHYPEESEPITTP